VRSISLSLVAAIAVTTVFTESAATGQETRASRTYVHSTLNDPASALRIRPRTIRMQGSGGISYTQLRWTSWGSARAHAVGRQCSARTGGPCVMARIRLSSRRRARGRLIYSCLRPLAAGEVTICLP